MSQAIPGDTTYTSVILPVKRGRGRPRKDPSLKRVRTVQVPLPPGYEQVKAIQAQQLDTVNVENDQMIGQAVTGIVESAFDAGYLLSVRIGDSNTNFRGIVFKPGHFDPVTSQNDVAPHVQMIKRNKISLPITKQVQVNGYNLSKKRAQLNVSPPTGAPSVPSIGAHGTVVPVVLRPVNQTNVLLPPNTQAPPGLSLAAHIAAPKERDVQSVTPLAMLPPDGSLTANQVTQAVNQEALVNGQDRDASLGERATMVQQKEVNPIVSNNTVKPMEVTEGVQGFPLSPNMNTEDFEASHRVSSILGRDIGDMNELPSMEPSHAVNSPLSTQATSVSKPLMSYGIGRMTELLQAVQENMMENQVLHAGEPTIGLGEECNRLKSPVNNEESSVQ